METEPYSHSTVLIFDRKLYVRKQLRSILNILGFWKIEECEDLEDVRHALAGRHFDLAIFAVQGKSDGVAKVVNDIRRFRCGDDPFLPILLTSWDVRLRLVRSIVNSGADDFLAHPYSTTNMGDRIKELVYNRKPFVVTEEYFGPDRRTAEVRANDAGTVEVPNALRARVEGRPELRPSSDVIEVALNQLRLVKVRNIARRIWAISDILYKGFDDPSLPDWIDRELEQMLKSAGGFHDALSPRELAQLGTLCDSVIQIANRLRGQRPSERDLELLEQSSLALRVAAQLGGDSSVTAAEISDAVAGVSSKNDELVRSVVG